MKTEKQRHIDEIIDIAMKETGSGAMSMEDALIYLFDEVRNERFKERHGAELLAKRSKEKETLERVVLNMAKEFFK